MDEGFKRMETKCKILLFFFVMVRSRLVFRAIQLIYLQLSIIEFYDAQMHADLRSAINKATNDLRSHINEAITQAMDSEP